MLVNGDEDLYCPGPRKTVPNQRCAILVFLGKSTFLTGFYFLLFVFHNISPPHYFIHSIYWFLCYFSLAFRTIIGIWTFLNSIMDWFCFFNFFRHAFNFPSYFAAPPTAAYGISMYQKPWYPKGFTKIWVFRCEVILAFISPALSF